ncbi:DUF6382 domain-containing protein [Cohnella sp. GCM10027633]|uniref:DUF6382 domain-containing protein n=1 Tax=unclassified Cohnella TaxID=2636738 RepID=UPI0036341FF8
MRIEEERGFTREAVNWTQLQMLKRCDIPGVLPIEIEQFDGKVAFKYDLNGCRMLGEALRVSKWTMEDLMGALSRLAEVLEDCRLYLLDAERVLLSDEFIYVGVDWQDIRFAYLPLIEKHDGGGNALEKLVVRWMTRVGNPDGEAMQQVLRIVAAPEFSAQELRSHVRQYFASRPPGSGQRSSEKPQAMSSFSPSLSEMQDDRVAPAPPHRDEGEASGKARGLSWRLLQPPSGDPHTLSGLLEDERPSWNEAYAPEVDRKPGSHGASEAVADAARPPMDPHRRRTMTGAAAAIIAAAAWRVLYLDNPGQASMLACLGITAMAIAGVLFLWNGAPKRFGSRAAASALHRQEAPNGPSDRDRGFTEPLDRWADEASEQSDFGRFRIRASDQRVQSHHYAGDRAPDGASSVAVPETTWLSSGQEDRTEALGHAHADSDPSCYLIWETRGDGNRIALRQPSLVIGRAADAATHVDETSGISRAHAEVVRVSEEWKVKDLGSRNGSRLNDRPMTPYELYPLRSGDRLTLAGSNYRFVKENA